MKKLLQDLVYGQRADGQPIQQPTFRTSYPAQSMSQNEWMNLVKFGSRYGTRGSFYENKPYVVKLALK